MPTGRIKYYNAEKGFGFIAQDSGDADVFLHNSSVQYWEDDELRVGQRVEYSVVEGKRGLVAQDVEVLLSPIERKWLRQGKAVIPRDYLGTLSQHPEKGYNLDQSLESGNVQKVDATGSRSESHKNVEPRTNEVTKKQGDGATDPKPQSKRVNRPTFGNLYIQKQIEFQTDMVFGLYDHQFISGTILEFNKYEFTLRVDGEELEVSRKNLKFCYKAQDTDKLDAILQHDETIQDLKLGPAGPSEDGFQIDTRQLVSAREDRVPIEVTMREGEVFRGSVDWESPSEIKLVLRNGAKIVLFRSAVEKFRVCSKKET